MLQIALFETMPLLSLFLDFNIDLSHFIPKICPGPACSLESVLEYGFTSILDY